MIYLHPSRKTLAFDLPTKTIKSNIDLFSSLIFNFVSNANSTQIQTRITTQKMRFFIKDFFSKCDQIRRFLQTSSHLLKKSVMENLIFCAVHNINNAYEQDMKV